MAYQPTILTATNGGTGLITSGAAGNLLTSNGSGGWVSSPPATSGTVTSVSGTLNRVSSTGGATPVIDIDAAYVGQASITTLGTITTGTWSGTSIAPTKGGTGLSSYTVGDLLYCSATDVLSKLAVGSNTQVLTLSGGVPTWAAPATSGTVTSVTGTLNRVTSTGGATPVIDIAATYVGQTSITTLGTITTGTWTGTAIASGYGGTGFSTYATGDLIYASGVNTLAKLAVGSNTQVLTLAAGVPTWAAPTGTVTSVTGTLNRVTSTGGATPVIDISASYVGQASITTLGTITTGTWTGTAVDATHGGTNQTTWATGDLLYASGVNTLAKLPAGSNTQVLTLAGGVPTWAAPSGGGVSSVTGTLNRVSSTGGSTPVIDIDAAYVGQTSITTLGTIATGTWSATAIGPTKGGTNQTSWATGDLLYASGVNTLAKLTAGSNTQVLTLAGGVPTWAAPATAGTVTGVTGTTNRVTSTGGATPQIDISASYVGQSSITTLGTITTGAWTGTAIAAINGGTAQTTWTTGDLLYASASNTLSKLGIGSSTQVLTVAGGVPTWAAAGGATALTFTTPGAYPYTTLSTDDIILVDTSSARTIIPQASPSTSKQLIIKDNVGSAATNNITITPSGKNVDGAASTTINIAYGSATIIYNGTQWIII